MKAKSKKVTEKLEYKQIKALLIKENQYIDELFRMLAIPSSALKDDNEEDVIRENAFEKKTSNDTSRAKSFEELQARFAELRGKKTKGYSDKLLKKNLKTRLKKKGKQLEKDNKLKLVRSQKLLNASVKKETEVNTESKIKPAKPVFNSEGKMVFSKFDFSNLGKQKAKKVEKDPKKILQNMKKEKDHIKELEGSGDKMKAQQIKEKLAWQNALAKAEGRKVKDDTELLHKSVKKQQQLKNKSKKKWDERIEGVKKAGEDRQKKRTDNIEKRKKEKKTKSMKKAVKKGKVIPGF